jgi:hypothetical protein
MHSIDIRSNPKKTRILFFNKKSIVLITQYALLYAICIINYTICSEKEFNIDFQHDHLKDKHCLLSNFNTTLHKSCNDNNFSVDFQHGHLKGKHLHLFLIFINFTTKNKRAHVEIAKGHFKKLR